MPDRASVRMVSLLSSTMTGAKPSVGSREHCEHRGKVVFDMIAVGPVIGTHHQVLEHGRAREHLAAFGHQNDAEIDAPRRRIGNDVLAVESDRAARRLLEADDQAQRGALAGGVGADQRDRFAGRHNDVDVAHDLVLGVVGAEPFDLKHAGAPGRR